MSWFKSQSFWNKAYQCHRNVCGLLELLIDNTKHDRKTQLTLCDVAWHLFLHLEVTGAGLGLVVQ